jgi:hypothetical protein
MTEPRHPATARRATARRATEHRTDRHPTTHPGTDHHPGKEPVVLASARCPTPTLSRGRPALPAYRCAVTEGVMSILVVDNRGTCGQLWYDHLTSG